MSPVELLLHQKPHSHFPELLTEVHWNKINKTLQHKEEKEVERRLKAAYKGEKKVLKVGDECLLYDHRSKTFKIKTNVFEVKDSR